MNVIELKDKIIHNTLGDELLILLYNDNTWLANQYIKQIAINKNLKIQYIDNLNQINNAEDEFYETTNQYLYVFNTTNLEVINIDISSLTNVIIKCTKIINENLNDYIVTLPKLCEWQIKDYINLKLNGLNIHENNWLCDIAKNDIYRLDNEAAKINIFNTQDQELIFKKINDDDGYIDLNPLTIFNFTNAILKKDKKSICDILENIKNIDVEPTGVVTILYKNFKNIINIQLTDHATAESLGLTSKQFYAIKCNCGYYSKERLLEIFNVITKIDYKLKNGDLPNDYIIDYLLTKLF